MGMRFIRCLSYIQNLMKYICYQRYRGGSYQGYVNIPYGSQLESIGFKLFYNSKFFGYTSSQVCFDHFMANDDGMGLDRGKLIQIIQKCLIKHPDRWARLSSNLKLQKFRRPEHQDVFVWNFKFYNATIEELEYIYSLVK